MRFCTNCGTRLPENGKFCIECGQRIPAEESVIEASVVEAPIVEAPVVEVSDTENSIQPTPTVQQPFVVPAESEYVPVVPVKAKPAKKNLLPIIIAAALAVVGVVVLLIALLGGGKVDESLLGVYHAVSCEVKGFVIEPEDEWIELKAKGKATLMLMEEDYDCKWSLDGEDITVKQSGETFEGTLKDGVMELNLDGMLYVFEKEGIKKAETENEDSQNTKETEPVEEKPSPVGYWTLLEITFEGVTLSGDELLGTFDAFFVQLNEDGTGVIQFGDEVDEVTWTDTEIIDSSDGVVSYELKEGQLRISSDGVVMVMVPGEPSAEPADVPAVGYQSEPGTYMAYYGQSDGMELDQEGLDATGGVYVTFYGDGTGMIDMAGEIFDMTYDADYIYCDGLEMDYVRDGGYMELYVNDTMWFYLNAQTEETAVIGDHTLPEEMNGDWYGWWGICEVYEGDAELVGNWWDACATLQDNGDGTVSFILWDEDTSYTNPLGEVTLELIAGDNGVVGFISTGGAFLDDPVEYGEWIFYSNDTEYTDTLGFFGEYQEEGLYIEFYFFLRPWGILWDDIASIDPDDMPYYYYDWYLPKLEEGWEDAPAVMDLR